MSKEDKQDLAVITLLAASIIGSGITAKRYVKAMAAERKAKKGLRKLFSKPGVFK